MDAALVRRLTSVALQECKLSPGSVPALVRLVGGGALAELDICGDGRALLDVPAALALGNALRASSTLTVVSLAYVALGGVFAAAAALLRALTGHPSLRSLDICCFFGDDPEDQDAAGALLAALVMANAPALTALNVSFCRLGDAGLRPLLNALPANTHLRKLSCRGASDALVRDVLLPAVRANTSLRELGIGRRRESEPAAAREALALVQRRADADAE